MKHLATVRKKDSTGRNHLLQYLYIMYGNDSCAGQTEGDSTLKESDIQIDPMNNSFIFIVLQFWVNYMMR